MEIHLNVFVVTLAVIALLLTGGLILRHLIIAKKQVHEQTRIIKKLQAQDQDRLERLETTLSPHLFKNILNSIQSHAYQTYFALDKLSNVLDYILYDSRQEFVTPAEEIAFVQNLIEINKMKLSPLFELQVKTKINEDDEYYSQAVLSGVCDYAVS